LGVAFLDIIFRKKSAKRPVEVSAEDVAVGPPKVTVGDMISKFTGLFGLPPKAALIFHDAIHAMSGLGIGIADEQRVIAIEHGIYCRNGSRNYTTAENEIIEAFAWAKQEIVSPAIPESLQNGLDKGRAIKAQKDTKMIGHDEIQRLFDIGIRMRDAIHHLTGKNYANLSLAQISALDFSRVNFAGEVLAVRQKHETPENRAVAVRLAKALRDAAKKEGRGLEVPRAGNSWVMRVK
jgi:hypothetical protein